MTKLTIEELDKAGMPGKETAMEKTARVAREIRDDEDEIRRKKTEHLKRSRLQYKRGGQGH